MDRDRPQSDLIEVARVERERLRQVERWANEVLERVSGRESVAGGSDPTSSVAGS